MTSSTSMNTILPSTTTTPSARTSTLSAGARAGMSTGIIVFVIGLFYGIYIYNERRKKRLREMRKANPHHHSHDTSQHSGHTDGTDTALFRPHGAVKKEGCVEGVKDGDDGIGIGNREVMVLVKGGEVLDPVVKEMEGRVGLVTYDGHVEKGEGNNKVDSVAEPDTLPV